MLTLCSEEDTLLFRQGMRRILEGMLQIREGEGDRIFERGGGSFAAALGVPSSARAFLRVVGHASG